MLVGNDQKMSEEVVLMANGEGRMLAFINH